MQPITRRKFLRSAGAGSLGAALGSCGSPTSFNGDRNLHRTPADQRLIVDAHCHVFNAADLDILTYARNIVRDKTGWFEWLARICFGKTLEILATDLRVLAPSGDVENQLLDKLLREVAGKDDDERWRIIGGYLGTTLEDRLARIKVARKEAFAALLNPLNWFRQMDAVADGIHDKAEKESFNRFKETTRDPKRREQALKYAESTATNLFNHFLNYRTFNAYQLWLQFNRDYGQSGGYYRPVNVDIFMPSSVDMNSWLDPKSQINLGNPKLAEHYTRADQQMEIMSKIAVLFRGDMLPIMGWCPRHAMRDRLGSPPRDPLALFRKAIFERGHIGAKLYPPMGFRACFNADLEHGLHRGFIETGFADGHYGNGDYANVRSFGAALDFELENLYSYCEAHDIPMMAHTCPTHGSKWRYHHRADPKFWGLVLGDKGKRGGVKIHPKLRINLAHMGGILSMPTSWLAELNSRTFLGYNWADTVARIVTHHPNAYTDLGDFTEIGDSGWPKKASDTFSKFSKKYGNGSHTFLGKTMYGSDWYCCSEADMMREDRKNHCDFDHMRDDFCVEERDPEKIVGSSYLQRWEKLFQSGFEQKEPHVTRRVMGNNALRFYGFSDPKIRGRIKDSLAHAADAAGHPRFTPRWWSKMERLCDSGVI